MTPPTPEPGETTGTPFTTTPPTFPGAAVPGGVPGVGTLPENRPVGIAPVGAIEIPGYEILGELGRGGMGVVYRARQVRAGREVALKMLLGGDHAGPGEVARFRTEAEVLARLQNPHIVTVYEVGEHAGRPFFSMEYCPGGALAQASGKPLSARAAAELLLQVARGVAAAHAAGVVHRDIKPGNVLLAADGSPKVSDFGLAKCADSPVAHLTNTGAVMGTPSYMAPEQAGGAKRAGPAADVYALGAVLYELLTGCPPFRGRTASETLLLLLTEDAPPPRNLCPALPRDLELICLRCLKKNPERRYPSAVELVEDLTRFLAGEPISSIRSGLVARLAQSIDRVQLHERFGSYGTLLLVLAPVMLLPELWVATVLWRGWPLTPMVVAGNVCRTVAFLLVVGYFRGWRYGPQGPLERQLWAVWGGYLLACFAVGVSSHAAHGFSSSAATYGQYQSLACLTALAFFALAPTVWGYCAVIGLGYLGLTFAMAIDLRWAPIEFGAAWAATLVLIGIRLRRLARAGPM